MKPQHMDQALIDKARRASLVEVVGRHVRLQRRGDEYIGSCPFHGERTPSFTIVPAKNFYHCFGCGAHGDALRFVMDNERLKFRDAVDRLPCTTAARGGPRQGPLAPDERGATIPNASAGGRGTCGERQRRSPARLRRAISRAAASHSTASAGRQGRCAIAAPWSTIQRGSYFRLWWRRCKGRTASS